MTFDELITALPDLPSQLRRHGWVRVVQHAQSATPAQLEALDRAIAGWPARTRVAWADWYAAFDPIEQTGPWEPSEVFRCLIQPTSPMFALARHVSLWFGEHVGAGTIDDLARRPWLNTISSVGLHAGYGAATGEAIARFVRDPATQHLRELTLALGGLELDLVARILAGIPEGLERLWIHDVRHEMRFAELLADFIASRPRLHGLELHGCPLGAAGIGLLAERGGFDRLDALTLHGVVLDDDAAIRLASRRSPGRLRTLELEEEFFDGNHAMRGPGLIALAEAGWFDGVESLSLAYHRLTGYVLGRVFECADLSRLRHLRLYLTGFDVGDAERLRGGRDELPALEHFELLHPQIEDDAAAELASSFRSERVRAWT